MLKRMKIGTALSLGFAAMLAAAVIVGLTARHGLNAVTDRTSELTDRALPRAQALAKLDRATADAQRSINALYMGRLSFERWKAAWGRLDEVLPLIEEARREWDAIPAADDVKTTWAALIADLGRWEDEYRRMAGALKERDRLLAGGLAYESREVQEAEARSWPSYERIRGLIKSVDGDLKQVRAAVAKESTLEGERARATTAQAATTLLVVLVACAAFAVALAFAMTRQVSRVVQALVREANGLADAVRKGALSARADAEAVHFQFRPVIEGMNQVMNAYMRPLEVAGKCLTRISKGDLPSPITDAYEGDFDEIKQALNRCIATLSALQAETDALVDAAVHGRLSLRAEAGRHLGSYRTLVEGLNRLLDTLVGHLEAMPAPALLIDREFRVQYMNAAGLDILGKPLSEVAGKRCSELFRSGDCNTERCACMRAMRDGTLAAGETECQVKAGRLEIAYSGVPVRGVGGDVIGAFEVLMDQTAVRTALRASDKIAAYHDRQVRRVVEALACVARGDLDVVVEPDAADAETKSAREHFAAIAAALGRSVVAVRQVASDANNLAEAAVAGKLSSRADASRHEGDFRKIVEGVNKTLDAVIAPIHESSTVLEQLARRDLRARVLGRYQGDHAKMKDAVNATAEALHGALVQVSAAVDQVSSAAAQIASSSQAVASGASEQASSLEETSSSVESVSAMTKQSADNAQQANQLASSAKGAAAEGASSMEQMQAAMSRIRASAEGTSQIIKDINDIAFQTNLLALNAAVEAARAGEAGRGFAVVAEEVRSLALRAKEAAMKTEELIRQSVKEAGEGQSTARSVAGKLGEIVQGVSKVTAIVAEIAAAAKEQSTGIDQVNKAVAEMDKVTQQNAASAEQSSSAASELSGQAEELAAMVGAFQLERRPEDKVAGRAGAKAPRPNGHANGKANGHSRALDPFPMDDSAVRDF